MREFDVEGIVLKAFPYRERERIVTLFTKEMGVLTLIVKGLSKKNTALINLTSPLTAGNYAFRKGNSDLYRFLDGSILQLHLHLRQDYHQLQTAIELLKVIQTTQFPEKSAPDLYALLRSYLMAISTCANLKALLMSYHLKVLKHEGAFFTPENLSQDDKKKFEKLAFAKKFSEIEGVIVEDHLEKIICEIAKGGT